MKEMKCWLTRRYNGLYLVTSFKPIIKEVMGTGHEDAYIKYGDPAGYINIAYEFGRRTFDNPPQERVKPQRATLIGSCQPAQEATHILVYDEKIQLYYIYKTHDCYINNVCPWFVEKVFGIKGTFKPQPIFFSGTMRKNEKGLTNCENESIIE